MIPTKMPNRPKDPARAINGNRSIRKAMDILKDGTTKLEIAVIATTMTMAGEMIPASTAACPITNVPTMEIADPIFLARCLPQNLEGNLHKDRLDKGRKRDLLTRPASPNRNLVGAFRDEKWLWQHRGKVQAKK